MSLAAAAIVVAGAEGLETGRARRREKDWDNDGSTVSAIAPVWSSSAPRFSLSKMPLIAASIIAPYKKEAACIVPVVRPHRPPAPRRPPRAKGQALGRRSPRPQPPGGSGSGSVMRSCLNLPDAGAPLPLSAGDISTNHN